MKILITIQLRERVSFSLQTREIISMRLRSYTTFFSLVISPRTTALQQNLDELHQSLFSGSVPPPLFDSTTMQLLSSPETDTAASANSASSPDEPVSFDSAYWQTAVMSSQAADTRSSDDSNVSPSDSAPSKAGKVSAGLGRLTGWEDEGWIQGKS